MNVMESGIILGGNENISVLILLYLGFETKQGRECWSDPR